MDLSRRTSQARFAAYVGALVEVIGHADRAKPLNDYCVGLLMPGERKSVEPIAAIVAPTRVSAKHQSRAIMRVTATSDRLRKRATKLSSRASEAR
jgi:SRSO17 transposase